MGVLEALIEATTFLENRGVPYAVIGGLAVQYWGEPRATRDVDIVVMVSGDRQEGFLSDALQQFRPRISDALAFARRNRVLLVSAVDGTPIDITLGILGYEEEVMRRAVNVAFPNLRPVRLISAEDLIIHKCVAGRPRDVEDVERILLRQRLDVDLRYIRRWLRAFAPVVDQHDPLVVFESAVRKTRSALRSFGGRL